VYAVKPIASRVPVSGVWLGQPIYVSDDDSEEAPALGRSTPGLKRKQPEVDRWRR
jgi:hypothetical protein